MATAPSPPASPPKKPRGCGCNVLSLFMLLVLLALPIPVWIWSLWVQYDWSRAVAETDQLDPRWRLEHIEADRKKIPAEENAALVIMALVPADRKGLPQLDRDDEEEIPKLHPTMQLDDQQTEALRDYLRKTGKPVQEARKLIDYSTGRFPIRYADDFMNTGDNEHHKAGLVIYWLIQDATLRAQDEEYDEAIASCRAMLAAARAVGDEPLLHAHLGRIQQQTAAVIAVERVLAQGTGSDASLAALQHSIEREVNESTWVHAARGERAGFAHTFDNIMKGKVSVSGMGENPSKRTFAHDLCDFFFSTLVRRDSPRALRITNQVLEHEKKPIHVRRVELRQLNEELDKKLERATLLMPAVTWLHGRDSESQALLRAMLVGIACERYRIAHHRWPDSLETLVADKLLDAVPLDPMDGQPLRYRRSDIGIVVYSIGDDDTDNQGNIDREKRGERGIDIGFRLWDVAQRRQLPLGP